MKRGDIILTRAGDLMEIVGMPLTKDDMAAVQFLDRDGGSFVDLDELDIEEVSGSFGSKMLFASQRKLHERLNRLGKV